MCVSGEPNQRTARLEHGNDVRSSDLARQSGYRSTAEKTLPGTCIAAKPSIIPQIPIQHLKKNNRVYVLEDNSVCVVNYRSEIVYHSPLDVIDGKFPDVINVIDKMGEWSDGTGAVPFDVAFLAKMTAQLKGGIRLFNSPTAICAVAGGQYPVQPGAMVFVMGRRDTCLSPAEAMNRIRDGH